MQPQSTNPSEDKNNLMAKMAAQAERAKDRTGQKAEIKKSESASLLQKMQSNSDDEHAEIVAELKAKGEVESLSLEEIEEKRKNAQAIINKAHQAENAEQIAKDKADNLAEFNRLEAEKEKNKEGRYSLRKGGNLTLPFRYQDQDLQLKFENGVLLLKGKLLAAFDKEYTRNEHLRRLCTRIEAAAIKQSDDLIAKYEKQRKTMNVHTKGAAAAGQGKQLAPHIQEKKGMAEIQRRLNSGKSTEELEDFANFGHSQ